MTKHRQITKKELIKGILRDLPEINPEYVEKVITEQKTSVFTVLDIPRLTKQLEIELYNETR